MDADWPTGGLDPVRRLRVLAAGLNPVMYAEAHLDVSFAEVWAVAGDLEGELPHLIPSIRAFRLEEGGAGGAAAGGRDRCRAVAHGPLGHAADFDVLLQSGWCLMQSRMVIGGMAAVAEGAGTRFAVLGGARPSWLRSGLSPLRPIGRGRGARMIDRARRRVAVRRVDVRESRS
ncbi:hypothetical protein [Streptomyces flavofungini]|uniref:Uncharacterized protein n=1 Tax=Streptomyces flavofungini TaxID=68200 RepID=A0ABS0WY55_9ACTN|nr:hypothetical protein [Streptomyces flavofungini]MBJ3805863.1 hypothetical protein [Streptomyces flavofungini]